MVLDKKISVVSDMNAKHWRAFDARSNDVDLTGVSGKIRVEATFAP